MSLKSRIQDAYPSFTASEKTIADSFLKDEQDVIELSAQALAKKIGTSAATIVRFARTLGYSGLPALKMDLLITKDKAVPDLTSELKQGEPVGKLVKTTYSHRQNNLENTCGMMDDAALAAAVKEIEKCRNVYLFGIGGSGIVCMDLYQKLNRIGRTAVYTMDSHAQLTSLSGLQKEDVLICISYSGETKSVLEAAHIAKDTGAFVIGISQLGKTSLSKVADDMLYLPVQENSLRAGAIASRDSSLFVTDVLYLSLVSDHLKESKAKLAKTKSWTEKI